MGERADAHAVVSDLLRVRQELGKTPSRDQYHGIPGRAAYGKFSKDVIKELFGGWTAFIHTAGVDRGRVKRDKQELRKRAFEHLKKEVDGRRLILPPPIAHSALIIGDLHAPYHHPDSIAFLLALDDKYKFDTVISIGDEIDGHALSFHEHDPDLLSPGHELDAAIRALEPLYKRFPKMQLCESNHGSLVYRKGKHFGLPRHVLKSYREVLCAPTEWVWEFEVSLQFPDGRRAICHHAYGNNVMLESQRRSTSLIQGHIHTAFGVQYWANLEREYFAAQTGCLIDDKALAYAYNKGATKRPLMGSLGIFAGVPKLLPMQVDTRGRWTGWVP